MPITLDGSNGITTPMYNGSITANAVTPSVNMKNRIINGAMVIDQRNAGASVAVSNATTTFLTDRFQTYEDTAGAFSWQQISDAPAGFNFSLRCTVTTANSSPSSSNIANFQHIIEGNNVADLNWGTANAKTITLSFWVKSTLTGTFGGSLLNSAVNRSYAFSYTISSANTWEQKTITVAGDTTGTWVTDNGAGLRVMFNIGGGSNVLGTPNVWTGSRLDGATGSTNILATLNATWQITGVQLEVGTTATSFDYRPYGTELALCQRYFYLAGRGDGSGVQKQLCSGGFLSSVQPEGILSFPVTMRTGPSLVVTTVTNGYIVEFAPSASVTFNSWAIFGTSAQSTLIYTTASGTAGYYARLGIVGSSTTTFVGFSAEL